MRHEPESDFAYQRADGAVVRRLDFPEARRSVQAIGGTEAAVFAQDRCSRIRALTSKRARVDRDGVLRHANVSPRIAPRCC
jgi:hypothetical protein